MEKEQFIEMEHQEVIKKYFKMLLDGKITTAKYQGIIKKHKELKKTIDKTFQF